jgi:hypothetical protein
MPMLNLHSQVRFLLWIFFLKGSLTYTL